MHLIRQSTASTVTVGPVLDSTGAAVTSAVVGDFRISKNGTTATLSGATVTHDANGYYNIALTTGNTDTAGRLVLFSGNTAQSMGAHRFTVLLPSVFDALIANATNATGGLPTATGAISAFAGAISTFAGGAVASVTGAVGSVTGNVGGSVLGNVSGSVGSIAGVTFPSNFASLSVDLSGRVLLQPTQTGVTIPTVTSLTNSVTVGGYAVGQSPLQPTIAGRTLDVTATGAAGIDWGNVENQNAIVNLSATLVNQVNEVVGPVGEISGITFPTHFDNLVIAPNGHVTATVDAINNNAITASSIQANAITSAKIAAGAITSTTFAADSITATALATSAGEEIADKVWDEAIAAHIASGSTGEALNNAGGSGNPWITDLSTGYTGTQAGNILNQVKAKTDLITTGTIQSSIPVTAQGQITGPLFIGDDYLSANGRAFQWTVALPSGFAIATSTCRFGMEHAEGATEGASFAVSGTVTDAGGGNVTLAFSVPKATTGALKAGFYRWSVEIASAGGNEVTRVASDGKKLVEWREKQT